MYSSWKNHSGVWECHTSTCPLTMIFLPSLPAVSLYALISLSIISGTVNERTGNPSSPITGLFPRRVSGFISFSIVTLLNWSFTIAILSVSERAAIGTQTPALPPNAFANAYRSVSSSCTSHSHSWGSCTLAVFCSCVTSSASAVSAASVSPVSVVCSVSALSCCVSPPAPHPAIAKTMPASVNPVNKFLNRPPFFISRLLFPRLRFRARTRSTTYDCKAKAGFLLYKCCHNTAHILR